MTCWLRFCKHVWLSLVAQWSHMQTSSRRSWLEPRTLSSQEEWVTKHDPDQVPVVPAQHLHFTRQDGQGVASSIELSSKLVHVIGLILQQLLKVMPLWLFNGFEFCIWMFLFASVLFFNWQPSRGWGIQCETEVRRLALQRVVSWCLIFASSLGRAKSSRPLNWTPWPRTSSRFLGKSSSKIWWQARSRRSKALNTCSFTNDQLIDNNKNHIIHRELPGWNEGCMKANHRSSIFTGEYEGGENPAIASPQFFNKSNRPSLLQNTMEQRITTPVTCTTFCHCMAWSFGLLPAR